MTETGTEYPLRIPKGDKNLTKEEAIDAMEGIISSEAVYTDYGKLTQRAKLVKIATTESEVDITE